MISVNLNFDAQAMFLQNGLVYNMGAGYQFCCRFPG